MYCMIQPIHFCTARWQFAVIVVVAVAVAVVVVVVAVAVAVVVVVAAVLVAVHGRRIARSYLNYSTN